MDGAVTLRTPPRANDAHAPPLMQLVCCEYEAKGSTTGKAEEPEKLPNKTLCKQWLAMATPYPSDVVDRRNATKGSAAEETDGPEKIG